MKKGLDTLWAFGRPALGTWSQIRSEECVDMLGIAGLDFTIVDCEHGAFGLETAEKLFRACDANGLVPLVRLPSADPVFAGQALDAGAAGLVVPGIESADQLKHIIAATRFAPDGTRGACPCVRAGGHFIRDWRGYVGEQARKTGTIALVETRKGLDAIADICAVPGLSALMLGPFDLSVSLGFAGDYRHRDVQAALDRMLAAARAANVPVFAPIFDPDPAEAARQRAEWSHRGAAHFVIGTDKILFTDAYRRYAGSLAVP
jgi:4-hydroxy-2-oxoheptanedioate aldolase